MSVSLSILTPIVFLVAVFPWASLSADLVRRPLSGFILRTTCAKLPVTASKRRAESISSAILGSSRRHRIDPLLVMAVIDHESRFDGSKRGSHGEIGLMQIKPATGRWLAQRSLQLGSVQRQSTSEAQARATHLFTRGPETLHFLPKVGGRHFPRFPFVRTGIGRTRS